MIEGFYPSPGDPETRRTEEFLAASTQGPWIAEIPLHCVIEACKGTPEATPDEKQRAWMG